VSETDRRAGWQKSPLTRRIDLTEIRERSCFAAGRALWKKKTDSVELQRGKEKNRGRERERERERGGGGGGGYREIHN